MTRTRVVNLGVVLVLAALAAWIVIEVLDEENASTDGPVIANEGTHDYSDGEITGSVDLVRGCLTIGDNLVIWPYGTSWGEDVQAVEFGGDFDGSVRVGEHFQGGGGYYHRKDLRGMPDLVISAIEACMDKTGLSEVVLANPG